MTNSYSSLDAQELQLIVDNDDGHFKEKLAWATDYWGMFGNIGIITFVNRFIFHQPSIQYYNNTAIIVLMYSFTYGLVPNAKAWFLIIIEYSFILQTLICLRWTLLFHRDNVSCLLLSVSIQQIYYNNL